LVLIRDSQYPTGIGPELKSHLLAGKQGNSLNPLSARLNRALIKGKIFSLPVRVCWQGSYRIADSIEFLVAIERFDYEEKILDLLRNKALYQKSQPESIDVIIPVYNAYDDLLRCLYSVILHRGDERIILIDDKSTDFRIGSLFKVLEPFQSSWFILIRQKKNMGFAATVNMGMSFSRNDVILLNSDTIVTRNWVKKLRETSRSLNNCGTLTPLSNNGVLSSVPVLMEKNSLYPGVSIERYADMVEKVSLHNYPVIPTGIGFCLYITRRCLDLTGIAPLLDQTQNNAKLSLN